MVRNRFPNTNWKETTRISFHARCACLSITIINKTNTKTTKECLTQRHRGESDGQCLLCLCLKPDYFFCGNIHNAMCQFYSWTNQAFRYIILFVQTWCSVYAYILRACLSLFSHLTHKNRSCFQSLLDKQRDEPVSVTISVYFVLFAMMKGIYDVKWNFVLSWSLMMTTNHNNRSHWQCKSTGLLFSGGSTEV